jgi:hypothetical protein
MSQATLEISNTMDAGFGAALRGVGYDTGMYRPFINEKGQSCVTLNTGEFEEKDGIIYPKQRTHFVSELMRRGRFNPTFNNVGLRKQQWQYLDKRLYGVVRDKLIAWSDLAASSSVGGFDAFGKLTYEYEAVNDPGEAMVSMDGRAAGRDDALRYSLRSIPLPIYHSDFTIGLRMEAVSKSNGGTGMSTVRLDSAGARVAEMIEDTVIGTITGPAYGTVSTGPGAHTGTSQVYGYLNFPYRIEKHDLHTPDGTNPDDIVQDLIEMRELLYEQNFDGPFMVYMSTDWDQWLDLDYGIFSGTSYALAPGKTLRERVMSIGGIKGIKRLPRLRSSTNPYTIIMVQMTSEVAEAINGATPRIQQWESRGGWELNFRVWAIQVPILRFDINERCGIVVGTTS